MKKLTQTALKKELNKKTKEELVQILCALYKENSSLQNQVNALFQGDAYSEELAAPYIQKIEKAFFPKSLANSGNYLKAKQILKDFQSVSSDKKSLAVLHLYFALNGSKYSSQFGDMPSAYYRSVVSAYQQAIDVLEKEDALFEKHKEAVYKAFHYSTDIAWGFGEEMAEIFYQIAWRYEEDEWEDW